VSAKTPEAGARHLLERPDNGGIYPAGRWATALSTCPIETRMTATGMSSSAFWPHDTTGPVGGRRDGRIEGNQWPNAWAAWAERMVPRRRHL